MSGRTATKFSTPVGTVKYAGRFRYVLAVPRPASHATKDKLTARVEKRSNTVAVLLTEVARRRIGEYAVVDSVTGETVSHRVVTTAATPGMTECRPCRGRGRATFVRAPRTVCALCEQDGLG